MAPGSVSVNRWKRYGHDRLYVASLDGTALGYWCLKTNEACPSAPEHLTVVTAAAEAWRLGQERASSTSAPPALHPAEPVVTAPPRPWVDLSANEPAAGVRERAQQERAAAPVRSVLARAFGVHTGERAWRVGADGEEAVAAQLEKLRKKDPRWLVLHSIPVGSRGADIDHLVVGPGGVFTLNAKHHPKATVWVGGHQFLVNGYRQHYLRNSEHEAERAAELLAAASGRRTHVHGVVVVVGAHELTVRSTPPAVSVVARRDVVGWLRRHGEILDAAAVASIFDAARRSTTWQP